MKLPGWWFVLLRKTPANYTGQLILNCKDGGLTSVERRDRWTEDLLLSRFREAKGQLEVQEEQPGNGQAEGNS